MIHAQIIVGWVLEPTRSLHREIRSVGSKNPPYEYGLLAPPSQLRRAGFNLPQGAGAAARLTGD